MTATAGHPLLRLRLPLPSSGGSTSPWRPPSRPCVCSAGRPFRPLAFALWLALAVPLVVFDSPALAQTGLRVPSSSPAAPAAPASIPPQSPIPQLSPFPQLSQLPQLPQLSQLSASTIRASPQARFDADTRAAARRAAQRAAALDPQERMRPDGDEADADSRWHVQRRVEFEADQLRNDRLHRGDPERRSDIEPMLRLGATWQASRHLLGFVEVEALLRHREEGGEATSTRGLLRLNQAYLELDDWIQATEIRLGRWVYRDEREWLFDQSIDGVLARSDFGRVEIDAMIGRVNHFRRDLLDSDTRGDPVNLYGLISRVEVGREFEVGAYAIVSHDTTGPTGQQRNLGLRAHGSLGNWAPWAELGIVNGHRGGRRLKGQAVDIGTVYTREDWPLQPRLIAGYAFGSGDDDPDDGTDRNFRQTRYHANEARLGGLYRRGIYGEVLDPELSNLHIVSAGIGLSPTPRWSIDLLWYGFRQDRIGDLRHARLDPRQDNRSGRALGNELNLVVAYAPSRAVIVGAVVGLFEPSARFERNEAGRHRDPGRAVYGGIEMKMRF